MGKFDNVVGISRRVMTLFFVVDTSGSMTGDKIGTVNNTMEEIIPTIRDISEKNTDALIKMAVLQFSKGAQWVMPEGVSKPIDVREYEWQHLTAKGLTDFGAACIELNEKMSRKEFIEETVGYYAPVIILLSDGEPTDDYRSGLGVLQQNTWYQNATKVAIAVGNDVNVQVLEEFTGKAENVVRVYDKDALKEWLKFVTVTSSKIGSTSTNIIQNKNDAIASAISTKKQESVAEAPAQPKPKATKPKAPAQPKPKAPAHPETVQPASEQPSPAQNITTPQESQAVSGLVEDEVGEDDFIW